MRTRSRHTQQQGSTRSQALTTQDINTDSKMEEGNKPGLNLVCLNQCLLSRCVAVISCNVTFSLLSVTFNLKLAAE